ncbi:hypothetical protein [Candidatus Magnetobacterium casense]|uniref:Uncharacterized protein n=1 Tax=Candidatus Magnetobacterium casense TaxID=1455061 RepID=A0ABS6RVJ2_9BACT|nr:hypothetical protein [Candidatus Magnetobacterium casensis]MBV6340648.1 hypothetical protein [Candidatus Magnetobacterium casensis]
MINAYQQRFIADAMLGRNEFTRCYLYDKVFWAGTHRDRFIKMVRGFLV